MENRPRALTIRGKFPGVVTASGPLVYVAEFSDGVVKVGYTSNARVRMSTMCYGARRLLGAVALTNFHTSIAQECDSVARDIERAALGRLREIARPVPGATEYFTGIAFADAVAVVSSVTHNQSRVSKRGVRDLSPGRLAGGFSFEGDARVHGLHGASAVARTPYPFRQTPATPSGIGRI